MIKPLINFSAFLNLDLRVGEVIMGNLVEGSEKLLELRVDFGELGQRTIYAGIKSWYQPKELIGRKLAFVVNLEPKKFKIGQNEYVSEGMLLAAGGERAYLYRFDEDLPVGTILR